MVKCNVKFTFSYLLFLILMLYVSIISEIIIISLSIFIHELFHVFISFIFGNRKIKIEVSMFGGICSIDTSLMSKNKRIIVYIFGIFANVILIFIFKYLYQCIYSQMIIKYNLMLICFSLLPIYPLDGYRIIREIFAEKTSIYISYITLFIIFLINIYLQSVGIFVIIIYLFFKQKNNKEEELFKKLLLIKNTCNYKKINV